ncbi:MAG: LysM domain-containing protein [bacterium]
MKRFSDKVWILGILALLWMGCKTIDGLSFRDQERNLRRQKRGTISEAGVYLNEFYEFSFRLPEGWKGKTNDPPQVLISEPSSKQVSNSKLRKNISISVQIIDLGLEEDIDDVVDRYAAERSYEKILVRPVEIAGFMSQKVLFYKQNENFSFKNLTLIVVNGEIGIVIGCSSPSSVFDNFETLFGAALDSFKSTRKDLEDLKQTEVTKTLDPALDYVSYIVSPLDTLETLAKLFLGSENRAELIAAENEIEVVKAGDRIKIPRQMPLVVSQGDSWITIALKMFNDAKYADIIKNYNSLTELTEGETIHVPFYFSETPVVGDSYIEIAKRHFNDPNLAQHVLEYNNMEPLDSLEKVKLPIAFIERIFVYKVQPNDSLAWIARWLTGDAKNYIQIAEANHIAPPYTLTVNQELKIPASLVPDPTVFDQPIPVPRPTPRPTRTQQTFEGETMPSPTRAPAPTPTPTPRPIKDSGIFDIE